MSTADQTEATTEEQVQEANAAEEQKWQGDFKEEDLEVPYKNEGDKDDKLDKDSKANKVTHAEGADDKEEDDDTQGDTYSEPASVITTEDPGEYKPADYSFEVKLADGQTKTIKTPEEADKLAEDPDNFETPAQLLDFIRKAQKMENKLDKDKESHEAKVEEHKKQTETERERRETVEGLTNEFLYLEGKGLLPKVAKKYRNADWNDPEVAKQTGVKEQIELLNYMVKENEVRIKAGVKQFGSVLDAFNSWQLDTDKQKQEAETKAQGQARRNAGAKVAGVSPSQQGAYVPKGIAVGDPTVLKRGAAQWDN